METRIVKMGENNVELRKVLEDPETGIEHIIETFSYGTERLNKQLGQVNTQIADWSDKTKIAEFVKEKLAFLQTRKAHLLAVQAELEK